MSNVNDRLRTFFHNYPSKEFKRGELILNPDQENRLVYFLEQGYVKQYSMSKDGRVKAVNIFKPHSFFPIILAIANYDNKFYFEAIDTVIARQAPVGDVLRLVMKDNQIIMDLCKRFLIGVEGVMNILQSIMYETSRKKLASFILMLSQRFGVKKDKSIRIEIPLTHQDIASFTGMIRETVSFEMKKLQKEGIIADNNRRKAIEILNEAALEKIIAE